MLFVEQKEFKDELVERKMYGFARIEKISDTRGQGIGDYRSFVEGRSGGRNLATWLIFVFVSSGQRKVECSIERTHSRDTAGCGPRDAAPIYNTEPNC